MPEASSQSKGTRYRFPVYEYGLRMPMDDNTARSFFRVENEARDKTYHIASEMASEVLGYVPSDKLIGQSRLDAWQGADTIDLGRFRPRNSA